MVGVTPPEFHGVYEGLDPEGYTPLSNLNRKELFTDRDRRALTTFARLKPGVGIREAQSAMDVLGSRFEQQYPASDKGITFSCHSRNRRSTRAAELRWRRVFH